MQWKHLWCAVTFGSRTAFWHRLLGEYDLGSRFLHGHRRPVLGLRRLVLQSGLLPVQQLYAADSNADSDAAACRSLCGYDADVRGSVRRHRDV